ncbi:MAG: hypothetical protein IH612_04380, partial [Desulfofustis sp.]|nr:hypothetical protein [Desulfofustis sp.]
MKRKVLCSLQVVLVVATISAFALYRKAPSSKVEITSTLIMLGDLDGDNSWSSADQTLLNKVVAKPYAVDVLTRYKTDVNKNGRIDLEDLRVLAVLFAEADPYKAEAVSHDLGLSFPRPRELFIYLPDHDYLQPPLVLLPSNALEQLPLTFVRELYTRESAGAYERQLLDELRDELLRLAQIYLERRDSLTVAEQHYLETKLSDLEQLYQHGYFFELLLAVIGLVEDGETLHYADQDQFIRKVLFFRDDLREILNSTEMDSFNQGKATHPDIFRLIEQSLKTQLNIDLDLATLGPPRDFTRLENYLDRIEWQKQKNAVTEEHFKRLILYAQHDRRYLRTVSRT